MAGSHRRHHAQCCSHSLPAWTTGSRFGALDRCAAASQFRLVQLSRADDTAVGARRKMNREERDDFLPYPSSTAWRGRLFRYSAVIAMRRYVAVCRCINTASPAAACDKQIKSPQRRSSYPYRPIDSSRCGVRCMLSAPRLPRISQNPDRRVVMARRPAPFNIRQLLETDHSSAYCDACLALRLQISLAEAGAAALTVAGEAGFLRDRRTCDSCGRKVEITTRAVKIRRQ